MSSHSTENNNNKNDSSVCGKNNAAEVYYEATLKLRSINDDDDDDSMVKEQFLGKLSRTSPCIHWKGNVVGAEGVVKGQAVIIEADWVEYRMHRAETKENALLSKTPST